ncbi:MAG: rhodanese-like domain-containing protein, partial [Tabrizicola sp.]
MPQFNQITPAQAFRLIGTPDAPMVLDVRTDEDVAALPRLIPTARHLAHNAVATLPQGPGSAIVVCTKGRKLSEGAAAWLRSMGWQAEVLEGGILAWDAAG